MKTQLYGYVLEREGWDEKFSKDKEFLNKFLRNWQRTVTGANKIKSNIIPVYKEDSNETFTDL